MELIDVNSSEYAHRTVNVDGATSSADIEQALDTSLANADPGRLHVRVTLTGMIAGSCRVSPQELAARYPDGKPFTQPYPATHAGEQQFDQLSQAPQ